MANERRWRKCFFAIYLDGVAAMPGSFLGIGVFDITYLQAVDVSESNQPSESGYPQFIGF
jgi:hypothetical protein